jgi:cell division protein FtsB
MIVALRHPFLWLAVTDHGALAKCPPRERYKQAALGGFVLSSSGLAGFGAFGTASEVGVPLAISLIAGLSIAAVVMNFDRYVIASVKRQETWWKTLLGISPRLLFSVAAGQVVTMTVLISLFGSTISSRVAADRQEALNGAQQLLAKQRAPLEALVHKRNELEAEVTEVDHGEALEADPEYASLSARLRTLDREAGEAETVALCELDGTCGSGDVGPGLNYKAKRERADRLKAEAEALKGQLASLAKSLSAEEAASGRTRARYDRSQIDELEGEIKRDQKRLGAQEGTLVSVTRKYDGPLARWDALGEVAHEHPSMATFKFWLWLTLLLLDTSPALMKALQLVGRMGAYEEAIEEADRVAVGKLEGGRRQEELNRDQGRADSERKRDAQEEISDYEIAKVVETAKHRIDLQAATERATDAHLDAGQRARNLRDIEELDTWIEPFRSEMNEQRYERWRQDLAAERDSETPWANPAADDPFSKAVDEVFRKNGEHRPAAD